MALSQLPSAAVEGIEAVPVQVEVDVAQGLPGFIVVGLADKAVDESRERIRSALRHSGFSWPISRVTVHLAPSERKKTGIHFDLPIALSLLLADGQLEFNDRLKEGFFIGGLSLDGKLQPVTGALILCELAKSAGYKSVILPKGNLAEAQLISGLNLVPLDNLTEVIGWVSGIDKESEPSLSRKAADSTSLDEEWLQIRGQQQAKRAALVCASGGHNLLLEGPPGAGKTLLAKGMRALLPPLEKSELIEVIKLHSVGHQLKHSGMIDGIGRPFRSPHHSASQVAIVGGGTHPRPGEIALAHRGILFLDELPEFPRSIIEALRQPLEEREVHVSRINQTVRYPANFMLVATLNPCPCGWYGSDQQQCVCSPHQIAQYRKRLSGPILDRMDLYLKVPSVSLSELQESAKTEERDELFRWRSLVKEARLRQRQRNGGELNNTLTAAQIKKYCLLEDQAQELLEKAESRLTLTGRTYHRLLKVARTLADLEGREYLAKRDLAEALYYRFPETDSF